VLVVSGAWFAKARFRGWQQQQLTTATDGFLKRGDLRSASLSAQQALQIDPGNLTAMLALARIAETRRSPDAILWRQKLADRDPGNPAALLDLVSTAISFNETAVAERALAQADQRERNTEAFLRAAADLAVAQKRFAEAEEAFEAALRLNPKSELLLLNLATLQLGLGKEPKTSEARATLERLSAKPEFRRPATRALVMDARRQGRSAEALDLTKKLATSPKAPLDDRLLYLEELIHAGDPAAPAELGALQVEAVARPETIYAVMSWMNAHGMPAQTVAWAERQPASSLREMPVPLARAEAYVALKDWGRLRELANVGTWQELDFLRLAILARVQDETTEHTRGSEFKLKWERALIATHGDTNALSMLARLVSGWGWKTEAAQVWWIVASKSTGQRPALKELYRIASDLKDTRELYRVARRVYEVEPENPAARNNVSMLALLRGENLPEAHRLAEENYRQFPIQPAIASTYAVSLYVQGKMQDAVAVVEKFPESAASNPSVAACEGIVLAATGQNDRAEPFLKAAARQKASLLPEETALVEKALGRTP